jgi:hypothetical protein
MAPRKPLQTISNNIQRKTTRRELSPATRGYIIGALDAGESTAEVAAKKNVKPDTVR